ncbi:MAG: hypothetical protein AB7I37_19505 [Pirellulales bacterium]
MSTTNASVELEPHYTVEEVRLQFANRPSVTTVNRWIYRGHNGIKLRTVKRDRRLVVPHSAIAEFIAATERSVARVPAADEDTSNNVPEYTPTRAMIWAETMRIQAGWSDDERRRRTGMIDLDRPPLRPIQLEPQLQRRLESE